MPKKLIIEAGSEFGRLSVVVETAPKGRLRAFECLCVCGNRVVATLCHLRSGHTLSCGCARQGDRGLGRPESIEGADWIPLAGNRWMLVDRADAPAFEKRNLHRTNGGYAAWTTAFGGRRRVRFVHREIMGLEEADARFVDHINGDKLDNRRSNLRVCSHAENMRNQRTRSASGFKGVHRHGRGWKAQIKLDGKISYLGTFDSPEEAARAYDTAADRLHGAFAAKNFP